MYRVCLAAGLLRLRLGGGRPAGDHRRRQRHQLLDLGWRRTRTPTRSSSRSSTRPTPGSPSTPRPATAGPGAATSDHGGPWVTTVGASTGPREFALDAAPDRRRRRDVRHARRHAHERHLDRDPGRPGAEHPGRGRAVPVDARRRRSATGKIVVCQRGDERPRRQGLQRPPGRRGRDDPLQPGQAGRRVATTTGCRRSTSTARDARCSPSSTATPT